VNQGEDNTKGIIVIIYDTCIILLQDKYIRKVLRHSAELFSVNCLVYLG